MQTITATELMSFLPFINKPMALLDIREAGEIHDGHIPGTTALPRRMVEIRIAQMIPSPETLIVLCDEGGRRAALAAETLENLGYKNVSVLKSGVPAWISAGGSIVKGKNVPSKAFAEHLFEDERIPQITPESLNEWKTKNKPHLLLDIRSPEEHRIGFVPGAQNVPGVEIGNLVGDIESSGVPVVVHCAGRTRSILACATLRDLGLSNVYALKNGTMGWTLAGLPLSTPEAGALLPAPTLSSKRAGAQRSRLLAQKSGVGYLNADSLKKLLMEREAGKTNLYVFDVRQENKFKESHIDGSISLPGGQAALFADEHIAVGGGTVVLVDDDQTQANITAYWLRRLGYPHVFVLEAGIPSWQAIGGALATGRGRTRPSSFHAAQSKTKKMTASDLHGLLSSESPVKIIDFNTSKRFAAGHVPGARWMARGWLEDRINDLQLKSDDRIVTACRDGLQSTYAAATLKRLGFKDVYVLDGGLQAWKQAGFSLAAEKIKGDANDVVQNPYERTKEDMINYLSWEQKLAKH